MKRHIALLIPLVLAACSGAGGNGFVADSRLIAPDDNLAENSPGLGFRNETCVAVSSEYLYISDPTYIADIYNSNDSFSAYLKQNGVVLANFGGDTDGPIYYKDPYVLILIASQSENNLDAGGVLNVFDDIGTDSGSFIVFAERDDIPADMRPVIGALQADSLLAKIKVANGNYCAFYEQWDGDPAAFYRNIVLKR